MVIVDTGVFIEFLRGKESLALQSLVLSGVVLLSGTVYLELLQGVRKSEQEYLDTFLHSIGKVLNWPQRETCLKILNISRGSGIKVGLPDIFILAESKCCLIISETKEENCFISCVFILIALYYVKFLLLLL